MSGYFSLFIFESCNDAIFAGCNLNKNLSNLFNVILKNYFCLVFKKYYEKHTIIFLLRKLLQTKNVTLNNY